MQIIGIGTDITECSRIARMLEHHGENFVARVFTPREIAYCQGRRDSVLRFSGRWAAKEAVLKAIGTGWATGITWRDVEVVNAPSGKPSVILTGGAASVAEKLGVNEVMISISHCDSHATAFAVASGNAS
ncbi:MAG: holo-ACP synthase [Thermoguttaceae bacterium]